MLLLTGILTIILYVFGIIFFGFGFYVLILLYKALKKYLDS